MVTRAGTRNWFARRRPECDGLVAEGHRCLEYPGLVLSEAVAHNRGRRRSRPVVLKQKWFHGSTNFGVQVLARRLACRRCRLHLGFR